MLKGLERWGGGRSVFDCSVGVERTWRLSIFMKADDVIYFRNIRDINS